MEEALQTATGSLSGKERIDALVAGGAPLEEGDIEEAKRVAKTAPNLAYLFAVIQFLVANGDIEAAVSYSLEQTAARQAIAFGHLAAQLVKEGHVSRALSLPVRVSDFENRHAIYQQIALTLAEKNPGAAQALLEQQYFSDGDLATIHAAIAQAYRRQGNASRATAHFHYALAHSAKSRGQALPTSPWRINALYPEVVILIQSGNIDQALRRLQELRPAFDTQEAISHGMYSGYISITKAFCDENHPEHAIALAKSIPDPGTSKKLLSLIAAWVVSQDQSPKTIGLVSEFQPRIAEAAKNFEIRAAAKRGDAAAALQLLTAIEKPMERRVLLVAIAQAVPK